MGDREKGKGDKEEETREAVEIKHSGDLCHDLAGIPRRL
jgi:hypothetical protein